jgi:PAS domain S-box-containing protein
MQSPPLPENEQQRLDRLLQLDVLDTPPEQPYDDITRLAALLCHTRFATVTLIDRDRQWFKSRQGGLEVQETHRDVAFCSHAILQQDLFIIEDAALDPRFADNPLVTGGPMIRFYAGAPLITNDGVAIGTLCVFNPRPGTLSTGQQEGLQLLASQVTERLEGRVETTLNRYVGNILDNSDLYVLLLDLRRDRVLYTNQALQGRLEHAGDTSSTVFSELFPDLRLQDFTADTRVERTLETRVCFNPEDTVTTWVRLISAREGGRDNLLVIIHDQAALRASRLDAREAQSNLRLFSQAAMQSRNLIVITDRQEHITWVNPSFETLTGYSLPEVTGQRPGELLQGPDTSPEARRRLREHIDKGQPVRQEILNYGRDGTPYWLDVYIQPIRDEQDRITHFVASQANITRRKEQELALRQARDTAERANRAKSDFLANISHELRTPLNGILGMAELMQDRAPDALQPMVQTLNLSSRHLLRLLNDILDLSYIESGHMSLDPAPMNPAAALQEVAELFRARAAEVGTDLELAVEGLDDVWVYGDATRIRQVMMNLVGNAVKFTEKGRILVQGGVVSQDDTQVRLELAVADTGPGIPVTEQQRIFDHFEQLDNSATRAHGGSGLGLAISRQLLQLMGADLALDSAPEQGARFHTTLTLARAESPGNDTDNAGKTPLREVLVVDDNEVNRQVLESMLFNAGAHRVYTAGSGRRGLTMLNNIHPDLVFVDIQMPGMDGFQFLEQARQRLSDTGQLTPRMIACTAHSGRDNRRRALASGFDAHLEKPVTREALEQLLNRLTIAVAGPATEQPVADTDATLTTGHTSHSLLDSAAMQRAFGDDRLLQEQFLALFLDNYPDHIAAIRQALTDHQLRQHADAAHTLKGLAGYFGNDELSKNTSELELAMRRNRSQQARHCFERVEAILAELVPTIKRTIGRQL